MEINNGDFVKRKDGYYIARQNLLKNCDMIHVEGGGRILTIHKDEILQVIKNNKEKTSTLLGNSK